MSRNYIDDGYTREVTLPATEFHDGFTFSYRPMTSRERLRHFKSLEGKDAVAAQEAAEKEIAARLVEWELGAITVDHVERLEPHLSAEIYNIIAGFTAPPGEQGDVERAEGDEKNS